MTATIQADFRSDLALHVISLQNLSRLEDEVC
jgi:hypothetical protein